MLCRFYSWDIRTVKNLTLPQANIYLGEIGVITRLESGVEEEKPLQGEVAHRVASQLFGRER